MAVPDFRRAAFATRRAVCYAPQASAVCRLTRPAVKLPLISVRSRESDAAQLRIEDSIFVALSRFTIRNAMDQAVREAFQSRPHLVDAAPGFLGMQVMSPIENPAEIWLLTRWTDQFSYQSWHRSHSYHESHCGIPKGLKLAPKSTEIRLFDVFAE